MCDYILSFENKRNVKTKNMQFIENRGDNTLFHLLIVCDDTTDELAFAPQSDMIHTLYIRGCHNYANTTTTSQTFNAVHSIIRVNTLGLDRS